jgi:hypothetical protein
LGEVPQESSENLKAPEFAPRDKRFNGRTKKIGFTCFPEFYQELRKLAFEENCKQIEILERSLELYKKKRQRRCSQCQKLIAENEIDNCENCGKEFHQECLTYYGELTFCRDCKRK